MALVISMELVHSRFNAAIQLIYHDFVANDLAWIDFSQKKVLRIEFVDRLEEFRCEMEFISHNVTYIKE